MAFVKSETIKPQANHHYYFVTGRLAETAVREIVAALSQQHGFAYTIGVMPITVAALMTPRWLRRHIDVPQVATHVVLPGYCETGVNELADSIKIPVICGPNDCRALGELFGDRPSQVVLDQYDVEIIAEINHATRLSIDEVIRRASALKKDGADVIDFGCDPVSPSPQTGQFVAALVDEGFRVSVDTFDVNEAAAATKNGASLVLSVNSSNREHAADWGCEVVVIPDSPSDEASLDRTIEFLAKKNVPMRLDSILEPIGTGFAESLLRYARIRKTYPELPAMMGIGNLTELTDVDSAGVNFLLICICQELGIHSVLTTQVINWARSSVRECDIARRLAFFSMANGIPPKRLSDQLVMLRDAKLRPYPQAALDDLARSLKDNNYRLFAQDDRIHLLAAGLKLSDDDPFRLFESLMEQEVSDNVDPGHAFYLGYEMAKASIALTLGKQYEQDQALDWGMLTKDEDLHRIKRTSRHRKPDA